MANSIFRCVVTDAGRPAAVELLADLGVGNAYPVPFNATGLHTDPTTHWGCSVVMSEAQTADFLADEGTLVGHNYAKCDSTGRAATQILRASDVPSLQDEVDVTAVSLFRLAAELGLQLVVNPTP